MNLSHLLEQRAALLRQAHLANLAYAYSQLAVYAARIARARLSGKVMLRHPSPEQELYCATLTALEGSQSVVDEHFTDLDVMDLADLIAFLGGQSQLELTFPIQELADKFLAPLRREIERLGGDLGTLKPAAATSREDDAPRSDCRQIEEKS